MLRSAGGLTRPAGCSETRHDRVLGHHQAVARQAPFTLSTHAVQGINNVVCTVEDMGVIRAHMTNSIDSWILGTLDEAKHVLENKLGDNYYQCVGLIVQYPDLLNNPNRDDLSSMVRFANPISFQGEAWDEAGGGVEYSGRVMPK
jgi:hypothetical protein